MKIGELADATQTPAATIHYDAQQVRVPASGCTGSNCRSYGPAHVRRLASIRHGRMLAMSLDEVRVPLRFQDQPSSDCGEVTAVLDDITHAAQGVRELQARRASAQPVQAKPAACWSNSIPQSPSRFCLGAGWCPGLRMAGRPGRACMRPGCRQKGP